MSMEFAADREMARGSAWMVAMRWAMRGIGIVSTLILARLLEPGDFGIIAMAMLVIGFLEILSQCGIDMRLIRLEAATRTDYDSAWTLKVLICGVLAVAIVLLAYPAAALWQEPKLVPVIQALSLKTLLMGFENIGLVEFRKNLQFSRDFRFQVLKKVVGFATVIGAALVLRNYWALVIGIVVSQVFSVALSYLLHPYRPRFSTARFRGLVAESIWMVAFRFSRFLQRRVDQFIVGGVAGIQFMGFYHLASEISTAPTNELVVPMSRGLYPVYARLQGDRAHLAESYLKVLGTVAFLCVPIGLGISLVAHDFVLFALGAKWRDLIPLMEVLAIFGSLFALMNTLEAVLIVIGRVRLLALIAFANVVCLAAVLTAVTQFAPVTAVAPARLGLVCLMLPLFLAVLCRVIPVTPAMLLRSLWPHLAAGGVMAAAVIAGHPAAWSEPGYRLALDVALGCVTYAVASVALWLLRGRPEGIEGHLLRYLGHVLGNGVRAATRVRAARRLGAAAARFFVAAPRKPARREEL